METHMQSMHMRFYRNEILYNHTSVSCQKNVMLVSGSVIEAVEQNPQSSRLQTGNNKT